jgi:hypothetical protein
VDACVCVCAWVCLRECVCVCVRARERERERASERERERGRANIYLSIYRSIDLSICSGVGGNSNPATAKKSQEAVLKALTRKMNLSPDVNLAAIAEACPDTYTGADLYAVCADAWTRSALRLIAYLESKRQGGEGNGEGGYEGSLVCAEATPQIVVLEQGDLEAAQQAVHTHAHRHTQIHTQRHIHTDTPTYTHSLSHLHTHRWHQVLQPRPLKSMRVFAPNSPTERSLSQAVT